MRKIFFLILMLIGIGVLFIAWANVPQSRLVDFNYEFLIEDIPEQVKELKIWFPYLPETPYQEIQEVNIEPQEGARISYDKT